MFGIRRLILILINRFSIENVAEGKLLNKQILCDQSNFDVNNPLIVFIGRLVGEKAADVLPDSILASIYSTQHNVSFLISWQWRG